jgi:formylglycine-generating enzyme required for sulfatase activity
MKNTLGMCLVRLNGGKFTMGDRTDETAKPLHDVTVSAFWIGQVEVTNAQFDKFKTRPRFPESLANNQPAVRVSYQDAESFCKWLSAREKRHYRLPTEAEWEYAARGGLHQKSYPWGNESVDGRAAFNQITTSPVGSFPPNNYGLFDMVGNAGEWVSDWYDPEYYSKSPSTNPRCSVPPPGKSAFRVVRGGSYPFFEFQCGGRELWADDIQSLGGFRIVFN